MHFISRLPDALPEAFGAFARPNDVPETIKREVLESFLQEVLGRHPSRLAIGTGDVRYALQPFFEILGDNGEFGAPYLGGLLVVVKLPDDSIRLPLFRPVNNSVDTDGISVV